MLSQKCGLQRRREDGRDHLTQSSKVARTKQRASKLRGLMSGPASEITPYLFVGGSSGAKDEADLAKRGITHVGAKQFDSS